MDVNVLGIFVVTEKGLGVFPTVQTTDLAEWRFDDCLEGVGLAVAPVSTFDMGGLDLATVVNDGSSWVNEGLEAISIANI